MTVLNGSSELTALVDMDGIVVRARDLVDGEWWFAVETTATDVGCAGCGTRAIGHGRVRSKVRDLPISGRPVVLVFARRRWRCCDADCEVLTWSEEIDHIMKRSSLTERARARIAADVNTTDATIASVASAFGVTWHTAAAAAADHTDPVIDDDVRFDGVTAIGVDEKRFTNARPGRSTVFSTQIVDLDAHVVLDVVEGRSRAVLGDWLDERGTDWCSNIELATLDPAAGYRSALVEHLPNAELVVDHWHAIKLANKAIDDIRRRVQQATLGHRGRKGDPLYRARRVFLTGWERLTPTRIDMLHAALDAGDPDGELGAAILAKELLREVYAAVDEAHARRLLIVFWQHCADTDVAELLRLARTIDRWADEILAYHRTSGASNGRVENTHMLIEKLRRNAHGYRNISNYRRRVIARLGTKWPTIPTRRIRGRQPHLNA